MGLFSRRERTPAAPGGDVDVVIDHAAGRARVGRYGRAVYPLMMDSDSETPDVTRLAPQHRPIRTVLESGLVVGYAFDDDDAWHYLSAATASEMGHDLDSLHAEALTWLTGAEFLWEGQSGRFRLEMPEGQEDLAASLVLRAPALRDIFGDEVPGDPVIAIGQRVTLHLCGSHDLESVDGLRELSAALYDSADAAPVSRRLLTITPEGRLRTL